MEAQQDLLTVREVARRCNRSEETIRRWIWSGRLAARKLGNQLFVSAEDVPGPYRDSKRSPKISGAPSQQSDEDAANPEWLKRSLELRKRLFKKYGYFDVAELVRQSREDH